MTTTRPDKVIPELCRDFVLSSTRKSYTYRDVILYALGLGVSTNPLDVDDLKYTYENSDDFAALPSYAVVIPPIEAVFDGLLSCPGIPDFNPMMLLHGEEKVHFNGTIPTEATIECTSRITEVLDKGKGALVCISCEMYEINPTSNQRVHSQQPPLCLVDMSVFIRGIGGFGGPRESVSTSNTTKPKSTVGAPDLVIKSQTASNQAILYRLSGDTNPLHIDPNLAAMGGFDRPILHGLCTYGIAAHAIIKHVGGNNPECLKSIEARFTAPVIPGDELAVQVWIDGPNEIRFNVKDLTTNAVCVGDGKAMLNVGTMQLKNKSNAKSSM